MYSGERETCWTFSLKASSLGNALLLLCQCSSHLNMQCTSVPLQREHSPGPGDAHCKLQTLLSSKLISVRRVSSWCRRWCFGASLLLTPRSPFHEVAISQYHPPNLLIATKLPLK